MLSALKRINFRALPILLGWVGLAHGALAQETLSLEWIQRAKLPSPEIETLPNGLKVAWFLNPSLPLMDVAVLVQSGYRDDEPGRSGTAQLLSILLDRGAGGQSAEQIARSIEKLGATRYIAADEDTFTLGAHGLATDSIPLLEYLQKVLLSPNLLKEEFDREKSRVIDYWSHLGDMAESLVALAYFRTVSSGSSYARGSVHSVQEFKKITPEDIRVFHQKHFVPKNCVLMVVGQVNKAQFREKIFEVFKNWNGDTPARVWKSYKNPLFQLSAGTKGFIVDRKDLSQAQIRIGFEAAPLKIPEHYSLVIANALLGEYFNSRLNSIVRDQLALTYGIGSSFSYSRDFSSFTISSSTRNEMVGPLIVKAIEIFKEVASGKIQENEISMAKDYLIGSFPLSTDTLNSVASRWLAGYVYDLGPEYLNEFISKVSATTLPEVIQAVRKYWNGKTPVIVIAGDTGKIEGSLKKSGLLPFKKIKAADLL